jgi:hypothetical protein
MLTAPIDAVARSALLLAIHSPRFLSRAVGLQPSDRDAQLLQNNVVVTSSDGSRARLSEAVIDIRGRKMISEKPVEVKGLEWTLSGNRVEITEGGALIRFDRGVTMTLMPARNAARADGERRPR